MSKTFDVRKPGTSPADPSGKPIVVSKPQVDPSVSVNGIADRRAPSSAARKIEIKDDGELVITGTAAANGPAPAAAEPAPETPAPASPASEAPKPDTADTDSMPEPEPEIPEQEEVQALADAAMEGMVEVDMPKPLPDVDFGTTVAAPEPVVAHHGSSAKTVVMIVVVVLLAAVILDILFDAGFVNAGPVPHTNFF